MIIDTQLIVHDAEEAKRYQQMGISESPTKLKVDFTFDMADVKNLTQHVLPEDDETELSELTLVRFYDGEGVPVTTPHSELSKKYREYKENRDAKLEELLKDQ